MSNRDREEKLLGEVPGLHVVTEHVTQYLDDKDFLNLMYVGQRVEEQH